MDIDKLLGQKPQCEDERSEQQSWLEIIKPPKVIIILGYVGKGKSGLAYYLAEMLIKENDLLGVVVNLPLNRASLLPNNFVVKQLEEVEHCENSVVIIDEGTTKLPAGNKMEELIKGYSSLCRQRNQVIILVFHSSRDAGSRILRGIGPIMIKEPSRRQIQFGSKDSWMKGLLETAKEKFKTIKEMGNDVREFVFVDCEEPEYQGIMKNELPSFWSEDLSKAWAGTDQNIPVRPVKPTLAIEIIEDPPQLSPDEAVSWQLQPLLPDYSQERILAIEAKWSKEELQDIAEKNNLRRSGGKDLLVRKLLYTGVLDNEGLLVAQNLKGEVPKWR
jgi:hypothetical protein